MELGNVEFSTIVPISEGPTKMTVSIKRSQKKKRELPDTSKIILGQPTSPKHLQRRTTINKPTPLGIPRSENIIIILLFRLCQIPRKLLPARPTLSLVVLLNRLHQILLLLRKLRGAASAIRCGCVDGHERLRHHLQSRVDPACHLRDECALGATAESGRPASSEPG